MNRLFLPGLLLLGLFGCSSPEPKDEEAQPQNSEKTEKPEEVAQVGATSGVGGEEVVEDQRSIRELLEELFREKNPEYNGGAQYQMDPSGVPVAMSLAGLPLEDITMLEGLPLERLDLSGTRVSDISALKGMPLDILALEQTRVEDLTPLKGAPIQMLYLNNTRVRSLKGLEGMPLRELYLPETRVTDLSPLAGMPLTGLWLNDTDVEDITVLGTLPLESVTLRGTRVKDLTPLASASRLQRIHIAESRVEDLTPLAGLKLTRLLFTPSRIQKGMDIFRLMPSIKELGDSFESKMHPAKFWEKYDAGGFR